MVKVLGIGAWDRSGSTIVANVLGAVPGVVSVGELNNLWHRGLELDRLCGCGERFSQCSFWQAVIEQAFPRGRKDPKLDRAMEARASLGNARLLRGFSAATSTPAAKSYGEALHALYVAIASVGQADVIVDSAKTPWHLAIASSLPNTEFTMLHLVRDPRGVSHALRKAKAYDPDSSRPQMMDRHGVLFTSLGWRYRNRVLAGIWGPTDRYQLERYEDFAAHPIDLVRRVLSVLDHHPARMPFTSVDEVVIPLTHSVSGNPLRFANGRIPIRLDEEWRERLGRPRRWLVTASTWPALSHYGYR